MPLDTGGKIRSYNILRHLARHHEVTLLSYYGGQRDPAYDAAIQRELPGAQTIYTAALDGTVSTGNGRRESYENKPIPRMTNTFIAPGRDRPDEVIRSVDHGLLIKKMGGGQVNTVTGDFVFDVQEGYLIEHGQVGDLVRGATLVGSGPEVLKSIDMVGSDLGDDVGGGTKSNGNLGQTNILHNRPLSGVHICCNAG